MSRTLPDLTQGFFFPITVRIDPLFVARESLLNEDLATFERTLKEGKFDPNQYTYTSQGYTKSFNLIEHAFFHLPLTLAIQFIKMAYQYGLDKNTTVDPNHYFFMIKNQKSADFNVDALMLAKRNLAVLKAKIAEEPQNLACALGTSF